MSKRNFNELEVEGKYRARNGKIVTIISKDRFVKTDPYRGDNKLWYTPNGNYYIGIKKRSQDDLIERIYNIEK